MFTQAEIQQKSTPTKKRIGRARFLLEYFIAAVLVKAGSGALEFTGIGDVVPWSVLSLGFVLSIWASIRRLRDIKRSVWWVTVPWILIGIAITLSGPSITDSIVGTAFMVVHSLFLMVLLFWPSAFPKGVGIEPVAGGQASTELSDTAHRASGANIKDALHIEYHNVLRMNRLNGWQRIGAILSVLWCFGVVGKTGYESYEAASFNKTIAGCCEAEKRFQTERKPGDLGRLSWCEVTGEPGCAQGTKPIAPQLLPFFALLLLPIAAGWLVVLIAISATKWVREGFKKK